MRESGTVTTSYLYFVSRVVPLVSINESPAKPRVYKVAMDISNSSRATNNVWLANLLLLDEWVT